MNNKILLAILVLVLVPVASADIIVNKYTNEFALSSSKISGKACSGSDFELPVKVENVGDEDAVFDVSVSSEQGWFSPEQDSFHLASDEEKQTTVTAGLPFEWTGVIDYTVTVDSTYGREKRLHRTLEVVKCQNLIVEETETTKAVNPAEVATFSFTVKNPTDFTDEYRIEVLDNEQHVELSERSFELGPKGKMEVFAYARLPGSEWGSFEFPVKVSAVNNELEKEITLDLRINRAYGFSLEAEEYVEACTDIGKEIPVTITNRAGIENTYELEMEGPWFASMGLESVTLDPNESVMINVDLEPVVAGSSSITISASSRLGNLKTSENIQVSTEDCYGHNVTVPSKTVMICGEEAINANVRNLGTKESRLALGLDAPGWMNLAMDSLVLSRSENENVPIILSPPCANGEYNFTLSAVNRNFTGYADSARGAVSIYTPRSAYSVGLRQRNFNVRYGQDTVEVIIDNNGIKGGRYDVSLGSDFLEPRQDSVSVNAGGSGRLTLELGDTSGLGYGEYLHTLNLTTDNVTYTAEIGTNLKGPGIFRSIGSWLVDTLVYSQWYSKIGLCGWSTIILILALVGLVLTAYGVTSERIETKRFTVDYRNQFRMLRSVLAVVVVLALIFFIASFSPYKPALYEKGTQAEGPLFIQVMEGQVERIDLGRYFMDPDKDVLTYNYNGTENVEVDIMDGVASISSEGWSGRENVTFTATDEAGVSESSPEMTVEVLQRREDVSWVDVWLANCTEVNALIIALMFLVLLFLVEQVAPRGKEYYFGGN